VSAAQFIPGRPAAPPPLRVFHPTRFIVVTKDARGMEYPLTESTDLAYALKTARDHKNAGNEVTFYMETPAYAILDLDKL
jgi:hypothetical protein